MAEDAPAAPTPGPVPHHSLALRIARWVAVALAALIVLVIALVFALDTGPGHRFLVARLSGYQTASGLKIELGGIDGSLYGKLQIRDLRISDPAGVFATAPRIDLDWRPFAYLNSHVDIRSATAPLITVARLPQLKPTPPTPNAGLLPDLDIDIGHLKVDRIVLGAPVTGTRRSMRLDGTAHIADGRAQITGHAAALDAGDRLALTLDAVPDKDRLVLDATLDAPTGGIVAGLAKLSQPLAVRIGGRGSWSAWQGKASATLGGQPLAALDLGARSGTFDVHGPLRPGLVMAGPVERLTAPQLDLDLTAAVANRRADTKLSLRSAALAVAGHGTIDLGTNSFGQFQLDARLLTPGAIAPNLSGRDVRASLLLDGPFAQPLVDYKLSAAALGFNGTVVEGLYAEGRSRVEAGRMLVPVAARAARVTGLSPTVGGLLTKLTVNGDLAINGATLLSDNLRLRSPQIDATAVIVADTARGIYKGALKGRINNYRIDGIGVINLTSDVKLATVPSGGFGLVGRFALDTVKIDSAGVASFLGGRARVSGAIGYDPQGVFVVRNLTVTAPRFRLTGGSGSYRPDGRIAFAAKGDSAQYGPIELTVSGTATKPVIVLHAASPNVGVQLTNVAATIRGTGTGYAVAATGGSPYGPFSADVLLRTGAGPLTIDIHRARFAGVNFSGTVHQAPAGPFVGRLAAAGSGITGTVELSAVGAAQRARVSARANGAHIPGQAKLVIDRAIVDATITLYARAPEIVADVQLAGIRQGGFFLQTARAKVNYVGGRGTAQVVATGRSSASFQVAANAELSPELYRVAATGNLAGIAFKLAQPAQIRKVAGSYVLLPATIVLPQGQVLVAGRYGDRLELQSRFTNLDMAILNAFAADAGVGGRATGSLDYVQAGTGAPTANLRLDIKSFTRSGAATVSTPVDIAALGQIRGDGDNLDAVIRRGGAVIGRIQVKLQPRGNAGLGALADAPMSGGVRYNGPADVLSSMAGLSGQSFSGPIGIAADFSGTPSSPQVNGVIRANALGYDNQTYGTRLSAIRLTGHFTNDRLEISELSGKAGKGTISGRGSVGFGKNAGYPIDVHVTLANAQLARSDALGATVSGDVAVTNSAANGALISGTLNLPEVRYEVIKQGAAEVAELQGVRRKGTSRAQAAQQAAAAGPPGLFKLDLRIRAANRLYVSGMGLESEWSADLRVRGTSAAPEVVGNVELVRGTYSFAGRRFDLDQASVIRFEGGAVSNPALSLTATGSVSGTSITLAISGRAQSPQISLTSSPSLPQDELLSRILFGGSVTSLSPIQALQLAAALNSLRPSSGGGLNPLGKLRAASGISRLRILGADEATGRGTAVAAGKYISNNIYVEIVTDTKGFTATQLEIALSKTLSILSRTGGTNGTELSVRYSKDY